MVVPDFNLLAFKLLDTAETVQGVMIIVEYRNFHAIYLGPFFPNSCFNSLLGWRVPQQLHHTPMLMIQNLGHQQVEAPVQTRPLPIHLRNSLEKSAPGGS